MERPGIRTTEFWLALVVAVLGGVATIYSDHPIAQIAGVVAAALASMGYGYARAAVKKVPPSDPQAGRARPAALGALAILGALVLTACNPRMIRAEAIDETLQGVMDRHDAYVEADPALDDLDRRSQLLDTSLLRRLLDEALDRVPPAPDAPGSGS